MKQNECKSILENSNDDVNSSHVTLNDSLFVQMHHQHRDQEPIQLMRRFELVPLQPELQVSNDKERKLRNEIARKVN
jgi:hypothetical protein